MSYVHDELTSQPNVDFLIHRELDYNICQPSIQEATRGIWSREGATHERADNDDDDEGPGDIVETTKNNDERVC
ncbi:hypothetical protein DFP72DRAFT_1086901 [Ephemerocybe angulata]|uniref:Uncharacterized protein n=1 Tax=Ephemerocybe angulata TaxID=980116 RepID=A0A8H6H5G8_9AGAR|nr:hypothetical protein DFP72DRAFT_1086901 [Tulosesus angulatus]